jgi:alpha-ketoglutarate-dependent taurine dioxygenase
MSTIPECGGDTMFASAYEAYDRLSPAMKVFVEGLTATHDAEVFREQARRYHFNLRTLPRGCPEDVGDAMRASHPVVRVNPVTGYKALNVNRTCVASTGGRWCL